MRIQVFESNLSSDPSWRSDFFGRETFLVPREVVYPREWRQKKARRAFSLPDSRLSSSNPLLPALLFSLTFLFWVSPAWFIGPVRPKPPRRFLGRGRWVRKASDPSLPTPAPWRHVNGGEGSREAVWSWRRTLGSLQSWVVPQENEDAQPLALCCPRRLKPPRGAFVLPHGALSKCKKNQHGRIAGQPP